MLNPPKIHRFGAQKESWQTWFKLMNYNYKQWIHLNPKCHSTNYQFNDAQETDISGLMSRLSSMRGMRYITPPMRNLKSPLNGGRDQCHADLVWKHTWKASKILAVCDACFDNQKKCEKSLGWFKAAFLLRGFPSKKNNNNLFPQFRSRELGQLILFREHFVSILRRNLIKRNHLFFPSCGCF